MLCVFVGICNFDIVKAETIVEKSTIWIIGDSTVSEFNDNYYYPRYGYGTQLGQYINPDMYEIKNLALSGRSSKSYTQDKEYKTLVGGMKDGDYLIVGFGHNDEKLEEERYTNPNGTYKDSGSFANSLYENYIVPAQKANCNVILCTPIVRRNEGSEWINSNLHITNTIGKYEGGDYPQAIRNLGLDLNIPVIDMTKLTKNLYDELGPLETLNFHAWTSSNSLSVDNTHTNIWGGRYNAYFIAKEIKTMSLNRSSNAMNLNRISEAILDEKIKFAPTKEATLVKNPNYEEKEYNPNLVDSELWQDVGIWKGTVFGNIGGNIDTANFSLGKNDDGKMNISVKNNKGKISNSADGLAMYYYKVPVGSSFALKATAKINSVIMNNEVSFGLMARDDMYIDEYSIALLGDYVAAGPLKMAESTSWNCFARKSGILTQGGTINNTSLNMEDTVELKIESNSDGYACTFGNEQTVTEGFDFPLTRIDSNYVYVGMFASRNADITFDNISLIIDGKEVSEEENEEDNDNIDDSSNRVSVTIMHPISYGHGKDKEIFEITLNGEKIGECIVEYLSVKGKGEIKVIYKMNDGINVEKASLKIVKNSKEYIVGFNETIKLKDYGINGSPKLDMIVDFEISK